MLRVSVSGLRVRGLGLIVQGTGVSKRTPITAVSDAKVCVRGSELEVQCFDNVSRSF